METIKFDLMGYRKLEFDERAVTWRAKEIYPVPLPSGLGTVTMVTNEPIRYEDVTHIGPVKRRQAWTLALVAIGALLGAIWFPEYWGEWGAFAGCAFFVALIGVWPLILFILGRRFLLIASADRVIAIPMDRKKKAVRRALEILRERCAPAAWKLDEGQAP